jgi:hypothetical protein
LIPNHEKEDNLHIKELVIDRIKEIFLKDNKKENEKDSEKIDDKILKTDIINLQNKLSHFELESSKKEKEIEKKNNEIEKLKKNNMDLTNFIKNSNNNIFNR